MILGSVALSGDGSLVAVGFGSPSVVRSGYVQWGDGGVNGDPQDTSTHSTNAAKSSRGTYPDNCALLMEFKLA